MAAPPEALLLRRRREQAGLSIRAAARKAGVSDALWRRVEGGRMLEAAASGVAVRGTAAKLAEMAAAVGVSPAELEAAGRAGAAEALRRRVEPPSSGVDELLEVVEGTRGFSRRSKRILRGVIEALAREEDGPGEPDREAPAG